MYKTLPKIEYYQVFFLLLVLLTTKANAQTYNFNNYSLKDGLIQSNVNDILQDQEGYIWFATDGGLSKFNGQNFVNYSTNEGLSEAAVNSICQDNEGQLWVGHSYGKLSIYDGKKFTNFPLKLKEKPSRICDITKDQNGNIWIGTIGSGAIKLNTKTKNI
jgi:ligand-binding sensor domain-containing protein